MSQLTTLSRPYAKAAFEEALAGGSLADWSRMLRVLSAVVSHEKVIALLASPGRSVNEKADALIALCNEELSDQGRNFVRVLAENKRLPLLPEISRLFDELKAVQEKTLEVEVVTAYALTDGAEEKLVEALRKRLQRDVTLSSRVDKALIGGLVIRAGDLVIDGSVRGRLDKLAEALNS